MSPSPRLTGMPIEILTRICECLRQDHTPSLLAFALANKLCQSIANPLLFHDIHLTFIDPASFSSSIQDCRGLLWRNAAFRHVRRLFIDEAGAAVDTETRPAVRARGGSTTDAQNHSERQMLRKPNLSFAADPLPTLDVLNTFSDADMPKAIHCVLRRPVANDFDTAEDAYMNNDHWQPLALLLEELAGLKELHFSCRGQFPPCLLQALHRHQPRCRLFLNAFRLRSLFSPAADPHELRLVTSPCLYRIRMACWHRPDQGTNTPRSDDADVVRHLVSVMAPNLKEIFLDHNDPNRFHRRRDASERPSPHWLAGSTSRPSQGLASLRTLLLAGNSYELLPESELEQWKASTDFSALQLLGLSFRSGVSLAMLQSLVHCDLSSLTTMVLSLKGGQLGYQELAERFLCGLTGLTTLHLLYFGSQTTAMIRLGQGLRTLSLRGRVVQALDIAQLRADCPLLEELGVTHRRSKGDEMEVNMYRTLASCLPRLRRLALTLDVQLASTMDADPSFDDFDRERYPGTNYLKGHLRDLFINSAMDETLSRAIFRIISAKTPQNSTALESLKIQFVGGWGTNFRAPALSRILSELRSSWLLVRKVREAQRDEIIATNISKPKHYKSSTIQQADSLTISEPYIILDRIWPSHGAPWPWKWESQPLQEPLQ